MSKVTVKHSQTDKDIAIVEIARAIDDFGYELKILLLNENQQIFLKMSKTQLYELFRDVSRY